jgi:hypothetical protein
MVYQVENGCQAAASLHIDVEIMHDKKFAKLFALTWTEDIASDIIKTPN